MDTFAEQLVKKNLTSAEKLKRILILAGSFILGGTAIGISSLFYMFPIGIIICATFIAAAIFICSNMNVEYEYCVTNGELDIDKIISQRKRKHFLSVKAADFTAYGIYNDLTAEADENTTFILACDGSGKGYWYADFTSGSYGKSRLLFCPDEKIRNCIKPYLQPSLKMALKKESGQ